MNKTKMRTATAAAKRIFEKSVQGNVTEKNGKQIIYSEYQIVRFNKDVKLDVEPIKNRIIVETVDTLIDKVDPIEWAEVQFENVKQAVKDKCQYIDVPFEGMKLWFDARKLKDEMQALASDHISLGRQDSENKPVKVIGREGDGVIVPVIKR